MTICGITLSSAAEIYICLPPCECLADCKSSSSSLCASFSYSACSDLKPPGKGLREGFCWVSVHYLSAFHTNFTHLNSLLSSLKDLWLMKRLLLGSVLVAGLTKHTISLILSISAAVKFPICTLHTPFLREVCAEQ